MPCTFIYTTVGRGPSNYSTLLIFIWAGIQVFLFFYNRNKRKSNKLLELQIAVKSKPCIFSPLLWRLCFSPAAPRPLERFTACNSAYKSHIRWYFGGNELLAAQLSTDLWSANSVFCCHPLWPLTQTGCCCAFPPLSTAAKWTRIDSLLSPAATQQKSSTSTRRKAVSPRTRMLMWLYGTPRWQGEDPTPAIQQYGRKLLE